MKILSKKAFCLVMYEAWNWRGKSEYEPQNGSVQIAEEVWGSHLSFKEGVIEFWNKKYGRTKDGDSKFITPLVGKAGYDKGKHASNLDGEAQWRVTLDCIGAMYDEYCLYMKEVRGV